MSGAVRHRPVLLAEVLRALAPRDGATYVDGTFGAGGYTRALLAAAQCIVWAIDRDPDAIAAAEDLARHHPGRVHAVHGRFGDMVDLLGKRGVTRADGVALDLGVSSMQLDQPDRGFSFRLEASLDMRMEKSGATAADLVNRLSEDELADLIFGYGEERKARQVARAIVRARGDAPITTTAELADIVRRAVRSTGRKPRGPEREEKIDPATRTFQALRIAVNDEMGELDRGLAAAETLLAPGGRLAVVSFHSLEDRRVKQFLRERSGHDIAVSRHLPPAAASAAPTFRVLDGGGVVPTAEEVAANPRARSARLRAAERTSAPAGSPRDWARVGEAA
jgi:16S rRNA (cytosine1402-N4)-methyltransferase